MADTMLPAEVADMTRLVSPTLTGDIRDQLLDFCKTRDGRPWSMLSEDEQTVQVQQMEHFGRLMVERTVQLVAAKGQDSIKCELKNVSHGEKGIKVSLEIPVFSEAAWMLLGQNKYFEIIAADPKAFTGQKKGGAAHVEPQQRQLLADEEEVTTQPPADKKVDVKSPAPPGDDPKPTPPPEPPAEPTSEVKKLTKKLVGELAAMVVKFMEFDEEGIPFEQAIEQALGAKNMGPPSDADRDKVEAKARELAPHLFGDDDGTEIEI